MLAVHVEGSSTRCDSDYDQALSPVTTLIDINWIYSQLKSHYVKTLIETNVTYYPVVVTVAPRERTLDEALHLSPMSLFLLEC